MSDAMNSYGAIVVMGVSGCGKSTVGRLLAARLGCRFIEGDEYHAASSIAKMQAGEPLNDDDRLPWLDRLGELLQIAVETEGAAVVACSALKKTYRDRLSQNAATPIVFILLDASYAELSSRLENRTGHFMPLSLLQSQFELLERPIFPEKSLTLDSSLSAEELCEASCLWLSKNDSGCP